MAAQQGSFELGLNLQILKDLAAAGESLSRTCRPLFEALQALQAAFEASPAIRNFSRLAAGIQASPSLRAGADLPERLAVRAPLSLRLLHGLTQPLAPRAALPSPFAPETPVESTPEDDVDYEEPISDGERAARLGRALLSNNRRASHLAVCARRQRAQERDAPLKRRAEEYRLRRPDASLTEVATRLAPDDGRSPHTIRQKLAALGIK